MLIDSLYLLTLERPEDLLSQSPDALSCLIPCETETFRSSLTFLLSYPEEKFTQHALFNGVLSKVILENLLGIILV